MKKFSDNENYRFECQSYSDIANENQKHEPVEKARERAEARLKEKVSAGEIASLNASIARSLAQLRVKRRRQV